MLLNPDSTAPCPHIEPIKQFWNWNTNSWTTPLNSSDRIFSIQDNIGKYVENRDLGTRTVGISF